MTLYPRGRTTNFQPRSADFTLCIFHDDFIRIGKLVSRIPYAETGGNLFGLWTNQGNAVVLVATGPGINCKRSSASFYQDIPYMQRVGNLLTGEYPLCHIGEWHSHHQMQLYQPSFGDRNTVQRNYPTGSQGFVLMIANILQNGKVKLSPYKFIDESSPYTGGGIEVISVENPFMNVRQITSAIKYGEEVKISQQSCQETLTEKYPCLPAEKQIVEGMNPKRNYLPSPPSNRRSGTPNKKLKRSSSPEGQKEYSWQKPTEQDEHRPRYIPRPTPQRKKESKPSPKRASGISIMPSLQSAMPIRTENLQETIHSHRSFTQAERIPPAGISTANPQERTQVQTQLWYEKQPDVLRTTLDFVISLADDQETVNMSRNKTTLNMTMEFTHHHHEWSIDFPSDFPRESVKLKKRFGFYEDIYPVQGRGDIESFKTKLKSTLEKECTTCLLRHQSLPARNPSANRQERSQLVQTDEDLSRNSYTSQWYETRPDIARTTFNFVTSLADDQNAIDISRDKTTLDMTLKFTHHNYKWSIEFPSDFPRGSVKLKKKFSFDYDTYLVEGRGDIESFKTKLKSTLEKECTRCVPRSNARYSVFH